MSEPLDGSKQKDASIPEKITIKSYVDEEGNKYEFKVDAEKVQKYWTTLKKKDKNKLGQGIFKTEITISKESKKKVPFAIKYAATGNNPQVAIQKLVKEAKTGVRLSHPFVIKFYGVVRHKTSVFLVMDYSPGSLDELMSKRRKKTGEKVPAAVISRIFHCLIAALHYLHTRRPSVFHLDVNPTNMLYIKNSSCFKLCGFGVAAEQMSAQLSGKKLTEPRDAYVPPEFASNSVLSPSSAYDIWSAAMMLAEIAQGVHPVKKIVRKINGVIDVTLPQQLDWLCDGHGKGPGECMFGEDEHGIPSELLPIWRQMTVVSAAYRIRYRGLKTGGSTDSDGDNGMEGTAVDELDKYEEQRRQNYKGPVGGLIDSEVFKKYGGDIKMNSMEDEKIVQDFVRGETDKTKTKTELEKSGEANETVSAEGDKIVQAFVRGETDTNKTKQEEPGWGEAGEIISPGDATVVQVFTRDEMKNEENTSGNLE